MKRNSTPGRASSKKSGKTSRPGSYKNSRTETGRRPARHTDSESDTRSTSGANPGKKDNYSTRRYRPSDDSSGKDKQRPSSRSFSRNTDANPESAPSAYPRNKNTSSSRSYRPSGDSEGRATRRPSSRSFSGDKDTNPESTSSAYPRNKNTSSSRSYRPSGDSEGRGTRRPSSRSFSENKDANSDSTSSAYPRNKNTSSSRSYRPSGDSEGKGSRRPSSRSFSGNRDTDSESRPSFGSDQRNSSDSRRYRPSEQTDRKDSRRPSSRSFSRSEEDIPSQERRDRNYSSGRKGFKGNTGSEEKKRGYSGKRQSFKSEEKGPHAGSSRAKYGKNSGKPTGKLHTSRNDQTGDLRLNKYIASTGLCSRREADEMISQGLITVNGKVVTELGTRISLHDEIRNNGTLLREERKVYIVLNKPKDVTTTTDDPHAKITVLDLVRGACRERIFPVGRLDRSTTGVLLLTNDGDLAKKLTHPKYNKKKIYHIFLDKKLKNEDFRHIMEGTLLEDGPIQPDAMNFVEDDDRTQIGMEIHSGRNRIVRRIFEHYGYRVKKLDRVYFAGLTKKGIERGHWRFLSEREIKMLKTGAYE